jgi:transposase
MTKNNNKRKKLNENHVSKIIEEWNKKSIEDFANEFEVAPNTVRNMVYAIRRVDSDLCPPKPKKKREDIVKAALLKLNQEDRITDK